MKKKKRGWGWFFVILGGLNIFRGGLMLSGNIINGNGILLGGLGLVALGIWMIKTSKPNK